MTKSRTLKNGSTVPELEEVVVLTVVTKCPEKYKLVDMETGTEYVGQTGGTYHWRKV